MRRGFVIVAAVALICAVLLELWLGQMDKLVTGRTHLIGEEIVDSEASAVSLAERMTAEADRLWGESDGWATYDTSAVRVDAIRVSGDYETAGLFLCRSRGLLTGASARATIEFLATPEGFQVIDPDSDPADFSKYLEQFAWRAGARLEVAEAHIEQRFMRRREFAVLNAIDVDSGIFVSKSILHAAKPGGSIWNRHNASVPPDGSVRALNSFAVRTTPHGDDCVVEILNFIDVGGSFPRRLTNMITAASLPDIHKRLQAAMSPAEDQ